MSAELLADRLAAQLDEARAHFPVGAAVTYWPGVRQGHGLPGRIWHEATVLGGHTLVTWIRDVDGTNVGALALTHVCVRR